MNETFKKIKGFADIYGPAVAVFNKIEDAARDIFPRYGFEEMRPPILEATHLFQRSIGEGTDVVQKEMFTFPDRKGRSLSLRPEATAGVLRACAENGLVQKGNIARLFTIGPMFRYERPQKGRMRQFHQINCECLGTDSPFADAELICMLWQFLTRLHLPSLTLKINSLGCNECRPAYLENLRKYFARFPVESWCQDCQKRIVLNPLRVLDCKMPECREKTRLAPRLLDNNCPKCAPHFQKVLSLLEGQGIMAEVDHRLVRGLDYYQKIAFEVVSDNIGAQTAVAGGGRYDGLLGLIGGPDLPGIGFACGMERLALLIDDISAPLPDFYFLSLDDGLRQRAFDLCERLRGAGFAGEMNYQSESMKSLLRAASRSGAKFCLILGPDENASNEVIAKNMETGVQNIVSQENLPERFGELLNLRAKLIS